MADLVHYSSEQLPPEIAAQFKALYQQIFLENGDDDDGMFELPYAPGRRLEHFMVIERGQLILYQCHIDPYAKAALVYNHEPKRPRRLLAHRREIKKLDAETQTRGTTLIPLAIYFKDGRAKVELGVGRGKQHHDKRDAIRKKEQDRELRRAMSHRR